jgi:hypothetical protein
MSLRLSVGTTLLDIGQEHLTRHCPVRLDNAKLIAFLGAEPHTPIDAAVRATLVGLRCLPDCDRARPTLQAGRDPNAVTRQATVSELTVDAAARSRLRQAQ